MTLLLAEPLAAAQATQADAAARDSAIAADVAAVMTGRHIPGAQVAIVMPDGTVWGRSFGLRDVAGAEGALLQAAKQGANSASSTFMLAVIAAAQGRIDTAFDRLDRALRTSGPQVDLGRAEMRILQSDARWQRIVAKAQRAR